MFLFILFLSAFCQLPLNFNGESRKLISSWNGRLWRRSKNIAKKFWWRIFFQHNSHTSRVLIFLGFLGDLQVLCNILDWKWGWVQETKNYGVCERSLRDFVLKVGLCLEKPKFSSSWTPPKRFCTKNCFVFRKTKILEFLNAVLEFFLQK